MQPGKAARLHFCSRSRKRAGQSLKMHEEQGSVIRIKKQGAFVNALFLVFPDDFAAHSSFFISLFSKRLTAFSSLTMRFRFVTIPLNGR